MNKKLIGGIVVVVVIAVFVVTIFSINQSRPSAGNGGTLQENSAAGVPENAAAEPVQ